MSAHTPPGQGMTVDDAESVILSGEKVKSLPAADGAVAAAKRVYALSMKLSESHGQLEQLDEDHPERGLLVAESTRLEGELLEAEHAAAASAITFPAAMLLAPIEERLARSEGHADVYADGGRLSHRPREVLKLSALLTLLHGRTDVTWSDHELATELFDHGQKVLDHQEMRKSFRAERQARERSEAQAGRAAAAHIAVKSVDTLEPYVREKIDRVLSRDGEATDATVYREVAGRHRKGNAAKDLIRRLIRTEFDRRVAAGEVESVVETRGDDPRPVVMYRPAGGGKNVEK